MPRIPGSSSRHGARDIREARLVPDRWLKNFSKFEQAALAEMVIIVDTRETRPYTFAGFNVRFAKLDAGDYSIAGFEDAITIERKELGDFLSSISSAGGGRERFQRELERMRNHEFRCVVIEADYSHISDGQHPFSKMTPEAAMGTMVAIWLDYDVPVFCCANRAQTQDFVFRTLMRFYLKKRGLK